jgi:AAHS family 4-hydroxybenzoate transporter-like MFS transporter
VGVVVGAPLAGPIGDRLGRRPLLLAIVAIIGASSLLTVFSGSIATLSLWRFLTGVGLGSAFPSAATLGGDYAPRRLRATIIMASFAGVPLGGFVGGLTVSLLLGRGFDWPVIFILGGALPLILLPILALWLPESPRFLARKSNLSARQAALLNRLGIARGQTDPQVFDLARGNPVKMLFSQGYAADCAALDRVLLQPDELVSVRLLAARGAAPSRADTGAGGLRHHPLCLRRSGRGALPRRSDRPPRS